MRAFYKLREFDTLRVGAGSHRHDVAAAVGDVAGAVQGDSGRASQRGALRRYVTGVLSDSRRKSMEAMWARLSDPGAYQASSTSSRHAPWAAESVWKRLRERVPERTGILILDGTVSQTRYGLGRRGAAVLWRARQNRELSDGGHGRAVDRHASVAAGRHAVPPRRVAHPTPAGAGTDPRR